MKFLLLFLFSSTCVFFCFSGRWSCALPVSDRLKTEYDYVDVSGGSTWVKRNRNQRKRSIVKGIIWK